MSQANVEGSLPQLKHLDISGRQELEINYLFTDSIQWNQLTTLGTTDLRVLNVEMESLSSLEELILMVSKSSEVVKVTRSWHHLQILQLDLHRLYGKVDDKYRNIASQIIDGIERGLFPVLKTFRHSIHRFIPSSDLFKLYKTNISVEQI